MVSISCCSSVPPPVHLKGLLALDRRGAELSRTGSLYANFTIKAIVVRARALRRDWCLGSEQFRKELLAAAAERVGLNHYGAERRESSEEKAERGVERQPLETERRRSRGAANCLSG